MICQSCRATMRSTPRLASSLHRALSTTTTTRSSSSSSIRHHLSSSTPLPPTPSSLSALLSPRRLYSSSSSSAAAPSEQPASPAAADPSMTDAESAIAALLTTHLDPTAVLVRDVSGGCGSMYAIEITSPRFRGLSILKQQRLVNAALGDVVKQWHGVQIRTSVPAG